MPANIDVPRLMRLADASLVLYGESTLASKARVSRLVDSGRLRAVRVGQRGDRWVVGDSLKALLAGDPDRALRSEHRPE